MLHPTSVPQEQAAETNWVMVVNATKLYLFLDDLFQPSPMLLVSVLLMIFSSPVNSSPVQSSPVIDDGRKEKRYCQQIMTVKTMVKSQIH